MITKRVRTFTGENRPGSLQFLHFFKDRSLWQKACGDFEINDEFDHSLIYQVEENKFSVRWFNKKGSIQFCGSGAYALAWFAGFKLKCNQVSIEARDFCLNAYKNNKEMELSFPAKPTELFGQLLGHPVYYNVSSGLYFFDLTLFDSPLKSLKIESFIEALYEKNVTEIHGLCLFKMTRQDFINELRYFTPWHGRPEDYVTGSIHQYLTPLVSILNKVENQTWLQVSCSPGQMITTINGPNVVLKGSCFLV